DTDRAFWRGAIEKGETTEDALAHAIGLMKKHNALADTIKRAISYGSVARDALAPLADTPQKAALLDVIDYCVARVS
ncbi:MAG: polyprenyl synthetase family protein, partial [Phyllobacteriaceae bacterium]|nr:polyprenyl synthetase family protein [Phyllobacteriaceae bacterium]